MVNYQVSHCYAVVQVLNIAAEMIDNATSNYNTMSVPQATGLKERLSEINTYKRIVLLWIQSHCGISESERADILALGGA